jgi:hypothetical protein
MAYQPTEQGMSLSSLFICHTHELQKEYSVHAVYATSNTLVYVNMFLTKNCHMEAVYSSSICFTTHKAPRR